METLSYARPGTENRREPWGPIGFRVSRRSVGLVLVCLTAWGWVWWWPGAWVEGRRFLVGPGGLARWVPTFEVTDGGRLVVDRGRLEVWDVHVGKRLADLDGYSVPADARSGALINGSREYFRVKPLTNTAEVIDLDRGRVAAEFALPQWPDLWRVTAACGGPRRVMLASLPNPYGGTRSIENRIYDLEWDDVRSDRPAVGRLKPVWTIPAGGHATFSDDGRMVALLMGPRSDQSGSLNWITGVYVVGDFTPLFTWSRQWNYPTQMRFTADGGELMVLTESEFARFDLRNRVERVSVNRPAGLLGWGLSRDGDHLLMHEGTSGTFGTGRRRRSYVTEPAWTRVVDGRTGAASPAASSAAGASTGIVPLAGDAFIGPPPGGQVESLATYDGASGRRRSIVRLPSVTGPQGQWLAPSRVSAAPGGGTFAVLQDATVTVFRQVGPDTPWGVFGLPWVWLAGALFFAAVGSVWADARARGRRAGAVERRVLGVRVSAVVVWGAGGFCALAVLGWVVREYPPARGLWGTPAVVAAGVGLGVGSRFWRWVGAGVLGGQAVWLAGLAGEAWRGGPGGRVVVGVVDRAVEVSGVVAVGGLVLAVVACAGVAGRLVWRR